METSLKGENQSIISRLTGFLERKARHSEFENMTKVIDEINALEPEFERLSDDELKSKTNDFRARLQQGETLEDLLPEAFTAVREASKRTIGLRHYDVQLIGGIAIHQGKIAEMKTGEGKTLVATLPLYLNALSGKGAHLVTVNDYLARRDARWMGPIFNALNMKVGILQASAVTENGKSAYLFDLEKESKDEAQHQMRKISRQEAYKVDITYGTNSEFGFDYLRDNMVMAEKDKAQRGHNFAIIDEVDNVLIDEARTPLIISGPGTAEVEWHQKMGGIVRQLKPEDYEVSEKDRTVTLTDVGQNRVESLLGQPLDNPEQPELISPFQARLSGYLEQALRAQFLFRRNKDYLVQDGKVVIVDEFTGRQMPSRRWSDGLHQAIEAKEDVKIEPENVTYATITLQNFFRMYQKLAGMTGTALSASEEFGKIYHLAVTPIPTNLEHQTIGKESRLVKRQGKDKNGYSYTYYVAPDAPLDAKPLFYERKDYPDVIYRTVEAKSRAITLEIIKKHVKGQPILIGTSSVENSERLSTRLGRESVHRLLQIALLRHVWLQYHHQVENGRKITELEFLNKPLQSVNEADLQRLARQLDMSLNLQTEDNVALLTEIFDFNPDDKFRLLSVLQMGIPHQVLNAKKHAEESQIIARAGAYGTITIATNMAGRGVDIKLGGELNEGTITAVNKVLEKSGVNNPYNMGIVECHQALVKADSASYGIYETEVKEFLQYFVDMARVKGLGGLLVIGSERHEARRIDNQLRGRAARQGDPGSTRFYLSLEDDLMRLFGGQKTSELMSHLGVDDSFPLTNKLVSNLVEQSQQRVEGANFDIRKHLLEYDDVLNTQRTRIYQQRNRILAKADLSSDVNNLLEVEVRQRVPLLLEEENGPLKLLLWLQSIQSPFSYPDRLLLNEFGDMVKATNFREAGIKLAQQAIEVEQAHMVDIINQLIDSAEDKNIIRLNKAVAGHLGVSLELKNSQLIKLSWENAVATIETAVHRLQKQQREKLVGEQGQVIKDLDKFLEGKDSGSLNQTERLKLLLFLTQGAKQVFDHRTHRQVRQNFTRFSYLPLLADRIENRSESELIEEVFNHLQQAQKRIRRVYLQEELNQFYRHLMLSAITESWVDYLNHVETLRVSIGLEAYAQRDPLTQYKSRASDMFAELIAEIRSRVVNNMLMSSTPFDRH